jgi:hypothetical protein
VPGQRRHELGALLSTEFGLSGESVRTRQPLRCDDAERDARVNREVCREMGIASVVVMPVVQEDEVLGVFELFSGKAHAFGERDLSALERLSQMVETAVRLAQAAEGLPEQLRTAEPVPEAVAGKISQAAEAGLRVETEAARQFPPASDARAGRAAAEGAPQPGPAAAAPRPVFWSAALNASAEGQKAEQPDRSHVPPVLRNLRQCEACGFPISAGRTLCVECEEKKWRGEMKISQGGAPRQASDPPPVAATRAFAAAAQAAPRMVPQRASTGGTAAIICSQPPAHPYSQSNDSAEAAADSSPQEAVLDLAASEVASETASETASEAAEERAEVPVPELVLSAGLEPSQSWFAANKYILGAILVVAAVVAAILLLR